MGLHEVLTSNLTFQKWMDKLSEEERRIVESTFNSALEFLSCFDEEYDQENTNSDAAKRKLISRRCQQLATQHSQSASTSKRRIQKVAIKHEENLTSFKRRKLERIKAPVVVFRKKTKTPQGPSDKEQEKSLKNTLAYLNQLPTQKVYEPPPAPLVTFGVGLETAAGTATDSLCHEKDEHEPDSILEYEYLTNEKDIALWKLITSSSTNCNVFVGNLSQQVSNEVLMAAFQGFCDSSVRDELKVRVVMNATKQQSKGFGFVSFPVRRAAELAMICMQEFELFGRVMQLGWGQDETNTSLSLSSTSVASLSSSASTTVSQMSSSRDVQQLVPTVRGAARGTPNFSALAQVQKLVSSLPALQQHKPQTSQITGKEEERKPKNTKSGHKVSDTLYSSHRQIIEPGAVLKKKSRWDQEVRTVSLECSSEIRVSKDGDNQPSDSTGGTMDKTCGMELHVNDMEMNENISTMEYAPLSSNVNEDTAIVSSCNGVCSGFTERVSVVRSNAKDESNNTRLSMECSTVYEDKTTSDDCEADSETSQHFITDSKTNNEDNVVDNDDTSCQVNSEALSEKPKVACKEVAGKTNETQVRRKLQWLTKEQKVGLLKFVCHRLRAAGVAGHVGVFGLHYEADNSRLYVVCAKHVTETELLEHFSKFGAAEVKLNRDSGGASKVLMQNLPNIFPSLPKGCAFVHYVDPTHATLAMKSSHGQVLGGLPLKVMVAEPKSRSGSKKKTRNP